MKDSTGQIMFPRPGNTPKEDTLAVMKFHKLPVRFSNAVMEESREAAKLLSSENYFKGRRDLRNKFIFTCDPKTARDYDDALSLDVDRSGNRVLGVHIADVSHFVREGSAIDKEAFKRSTSVYFCDRVVPMLPEELCNGVCSLVPGKDRLAFSVFMTFDKFGNMVKREFFKSVIRSKARFTYEEVMKIIAGGESSKIDKKSRKTILGISGLAQELRALRFRSGALDIEIPEAEVMLDAEGEMTGIITRAYDESHQMIEECMVAANEAVAKELWTKGIKILSRLHESPDEEKIMMLRADLRALNVKVGDISKPKVFSQFLKTIKKHPLYPTISVMVLRSMKRAVYDSESIGHFGLAKKYYAHFTSPIRRYPDLVLHRQLAKYIAKKDARMSPRTLAKLAEHTTQMEEIAAEAERELVEIKKFRLMESILASHQIVDYDAIITKVTPFGCFVELPEIAVSGLVHVSLLSNRYVRYDEGMRTLVAPGGKRWMVGDKMKVHVASVDFRQRRLDFKPCELKEKSRRFRR